MNKARTRAALLSISTGLIVAAVGCGGNDPGPACQPRALLFDNDSVIYAYTDGRIRTVSYYVSGRQTNQDDLDYNSSGQLVTIAKVTLAFDGSPSVDSHHTLTYGSDGRPSQLTTDSQVGKFTTTFTHNDSGQLETAKTSSGVQLAFVGTTRYEYDTNGNIPKVYYALNINHKIVEKLARENLSFDETEKFYNHNTELKILNEYVYGYLPNKNNCLSSVVHYYSYAQHFTTPLSISFIATYDDDGQINSLQTSGPNTQLYSGEVLFKGVLYDCH